MIKYTITVSNGQKEAVGYIESAYPLKGDEPVVNQRFAAILALIEPDSMDDYFEHIKYLGIETTKKKG